MLFSSRPLVISLFMFFSSVSITNSAYALNCNSESDAITTFNKLHAKVVEDTWYKDLAFSNRSKSKSTHVILFECIDHEFYDFEGYCIGYRYRSTISKWDCMELSFEVSKDRVGFQDQFILFVPGALRTSTISYFPGKKKSIPNTQISSSGDFLTTPLISFIELRSISLIRSKSSLLIVLKS